MDNLVKALSLQVYSTRFIFSTDYYIGIQYYFGIDIFLYRQEYGVFASHVGGFVKDYLLASTPQKIAYSVAKVLL